MRKRPARVLVIESDEDDAAMIDSYLAGGPGSEEELHVTHAPRLSSACHLIASQDFDAVLLDLALPQTVGLDGFHKIRAIRPLMPVIMLTGKKDEHLAARAVKLGAQDYFIKGSPDCLLLKRAVRYALEKKLLASAFEELLVLDSVPRLVVDSDHVVRFANAAVEPVLGRAPEELLNRPFSRALPADDARSPGDSAAAQDMRVKMHVRPISWHGEPARLVSLLEGAARGEPGILEAGNHFLSRISHEMRNTLATMKTAAYCLKEGGDDTLTTQQTLLVDMIARNINRQTKIVENILDMARFRSGRLKIQFRQADAAAIIAHLAEEYRSSRGTKLLQVRVNGDLPRISCDPDLIAQVLRNLLDNAARHAKEKIAIEASQDGPDSIAVSVSDDGEGIAEEHLDGLFTRFLNLEGPANDGEHRGTGLGLAICKEIIEGHHGKIQANSTAGLGACFRFELPVRNGHEEAAPEGAGRKPSYPVKTSQLLHK